MTLTERLERWVAIAETCSDKRMAVIVDEMRDTIEQLKDLDNARARLQEPQEIRREHEMAEWPWVRATCITLVEESRGTHP